MNYKQLKTLAILCMVFDHAVRIFPLYRMFAPWRTGFGHAAMALRPTGSWTACLFT